MLAPQCWGRFYLYLVFKNLSIIGQCLMNMNISPQTVGAPNTKLVSLEKSSNNFDLISVIYGD
jgi:hypothetical protein